MGGGAGLDFFYSRVFLGIFFYFRVVYVVPLGFGRVVRSTLWLVGLDLEM